MIDGMRVLVVGSGAREHAMAWKVAQSARVKELFIAPGNPGTGSLGVNVPIPLERIDDLVNFARERLIDLTLVGPEAPLVAGITDAFALAGLRCWGPSALAARLEASKVEMKQFLRRYNIPTAQYKVFEDPMIAHDYLEQVGAPVVVKCDGLAGGKGVTVARTLSDAHDAVNAILSRRVFGAEACRSLVIEECLHGEEISVLVLCDGHNAVFLDYVQDHKPLLDGDQGPNTGGMGAYSPVADLLRPRDEEDIVRRIVIPTMDGLVREDRPYRGLLYLGLMLTEAGPKVLEYNVRFGDPECQALMLRLKTDLVDVCEACIDGTLDHVELEWREETVVCVVMASPGYPGTCPQGLPITGLDQAGPDVTVFHAGTALAGDQPLAEGGPVVTAGGRVLSVCAMGVDLEEARSRVYAACERIQFEGKQYRRDIGRRHG